MLPYSASCKQKHDCQLLEATLWMLSVACSTRAACFALTQAPIARYQPVGALVSCKRGIPELTRSFALRQVCGVTCSGAANFEQHCMSWRHQRRVASAASATLRAAGVEQGPLPASGSGTGPSGAGGEAGSSGMTYVGPQAQCRNYCRQVSGCRNSL